jgi:UDP-glucose 4-epimerase
MPIVFIRPFNTFGPYQSDRAVIPELIIKCLKGLPIETTEGKQTREFNYVDNIVDGFLAIATNEPLPKEPINIGSNHEVAICDLVRKIHELCDSKSELKIGALENRPTEIWRMSADNNRAMEVLNWKPIVSFDDGLEKTVEWFKDFIDVFYNVNGSLNRL